MKQGSNHGYLNFQRDSYSLAAREHRLGWMRVDRLLREHGSSEDTAAGRREFKRRMDGKRGAHHAGELRLETAEAKAERSVAEALRRLGGAQEELVRRPKNDAGKLAMAVQLRRETTLSDKQIAARAHLGTSQTANKRLHQATKALEVLGTNQNRIG